MHSPSCGFENPEGLKCCHECGAPLRIPCAQCGFVNQPQAVFCGKCGSAFSLRARAATAPPTVPHHQAPLPQAKAALAQMEGR